MKEKKTIVIIGGGFGGVMCAKALRRHAARMVDVILFDRENHMVFYPLLPEVAGAGINPDAAAAPLRQMLPGVSCRTEEVTRVHLAESRVEYLAHDGRPSSRSYDHIVLACGSVVNLGIVPGMADHAFPLKTIGDALAIRHHVSQQMEKAEVCDDPNQRRHYLSFIVIGGGFSGIEVAGEINDFLRSSLRFYRNLRKDTPRITVIEMLDRPLPEISDRLQRFAQKRMEASGIQFLFNAAAAMVTADGVILTDQRAVRAGTVISTVGNAPAPIVRKLGVPKIKGRIETDHDMRITGWGNAWAIGDCAHIVNAFDGKAAPATGQFAEREGGQAAQNIVRVLRSEATRPFHFKPLGELCSIGGRRAVADVLGVQMAGLFAWFLWRAVYLFKMPSWARRVKVGLDWAWELVFSRDIASTRADTTERISNALVHAGDVIFREGEAATDFYVIEKGTVAIIKRTGNREEVLAILGPGDFFGELALIDDRPRQSSARAVTAAELVVVGRKAFSSMKNAFTAFKDIIENARRRRTRGGWQEAPFVHDILKAHPLPDFLEALPGPLLKESLTVRDALHTFNDQPIGFSCVTGTDGTLTGVVTRADFLRAIETGARGETPLAAIMTRHPISLVRADSSVLAASTMREHGLAWLPVVESRAENRIIGHVRAERMLETILAELPATTATAPSAPLETHAQPGA